MTPDEAAARDEARLRHALRGLTLDARDERYVRHYARVWDAETVDVIAGWLDKARASDRAPDER